MRRRVTLLIPSLAAVALSAWAAQSPDLQSALTSAQTAFVSEPAEPPRPTVLNGGGAWKPKGPRAQPEKLTLQGRVSHVRDGDTIEVAGVPVRLAKLDCQERGTKGGEIATRVMTELVSRQHLSCQLAGRMSYDRQIGTCAMADGRDIGDILISGGYCGRYR